MLLITGRNLNSKKTSMHVFLVKYLFKFIIPKFLDRKIFNTSKTIGEFKKYIWWARRFGLKRKCKIYNFKGSRICAGSRIKKKRRFVSIKKKKFKIIFFSS